MVNLLRHICSKLKVYMSLAGKKGDKAEEAEPMDATANDGAS